MVTLTGLKTAPAGTVTVNAVAEAAVTAAFTSPIKTILLAGIELKFEPVMVTEVPTGPDTGKKELRVGWAKILTDIPKKRK